MAIVTYLLSNSGSGKTSSLRNFEPDDIMVIQPIKKELPFPSKGWKYWNKNEQKGSLFATDNYAVIQAMMKKSVDIGKKTIVIDDTNYLMSNEFMSRIDENGWDKYNDMSKKMNDLILFAKSELPDDVTVYLFSHTQNDDGVDNPKTIGKLLDDKIYLPGLVTIIIQSVVNADGYWFLTKKKPNNVVKTPMGLVDEELIENDLKAFDEKVKAYYAQ